MELYSLKFVEGVVKKCKRIVRGIGFGYGCIVICGYKGVKFCFGFKNKCNFEGGQMFF